MKTHRKLSRVLMLMLTFAFLMQGIVFAKDLPFIDVSPEAWYYADVKTAYETGLINGRSATIFAPDENMTYAEAIKLAACMHQLRNDGKVTLTTGEPWYITYVNYAKLKKLITGDLSWDDIATRAGYMQIFAQVLPEISDPLNIIDDGSIPDVPMSHKNAAAIYKLYRYGIVQGVDALHNCNPEGNIKRSEVAAILTRMMNESKRISFKMGGETDSGKLQITEQPTSQQMNKTPTDSLTFSVKISGGKAPYTYKWCYQYESDEIETNSRMKSDKSDSITLTVSDKKGVFAIWCVITDETGKNITSEKVFAYVSMDYVFIDEHPKDRQMTKSPSETLEFSVKIREGKAPFTYKWCYQYGSGNIETVTQTSSDRTNTISVNVFDNKGTFTIWCVVTGVTGHTSTTNKAKAIPKAVDKLTIIQHPKDQQMTASVQEFTFSVTVSGGEGPYKYEWRYWIKGQRGYNFKTYESFSKTHEFKIGIDIKNLDGSVPLDVHCVITDGSGQTVESNKANIKGVSPLNIIKHPQSSKLERDFEFFGFTVSVSGGYGPYKYEWRYWYKGQRGYNFTTHESFSKTDEFEIGIDERDLYGSEPFTVYCIITDGLGQTVESNKATVRF